MRQAAVEAAQNVEQPGEQLVVFAPGSIEHARAHRRRRVQEALQDFPASSVSLPVGEQAARFFSTNSGVWDALHLVGDTVQQGVCLAARFSFEKQPVENRLTSTAANVNKFKGLALMSDKALAKVLADDSRAPNSKEHSRIASSMIHLASACVNSGELLWTAFLQRLAMKLQSGEWEGVLLAQQARYDESPLKVRIRTDGPNVCVCTRTPRNLTMGKLCNLRPPSMFWCLRVTSRSTCISGATFPAP